MKQILIKLKCGYITRQLITFQWLVQGYEGSGLNRLEKSEMRGGGSINHNHPQQKIIKYCNKARKRAMKERGLK